MLEPRSFASEPSDSHTIGPVAPGEITVPGLIMGCHLPCRLSAPALLPRRSSRRKIRSGRLSTQHLRSKDKVERLAAMVGEQGSPVVRRVTRAAAAAAAASRASAAPSPAPESPPDLTREPVVAIGAAERHSAEKCLAQLVAALAPRQAPSPATAAASQGMETLVEESTPKKLEPGRPESVRVSALVAAPQDPRTPGTGSGRSACKLKIARASPGPQDSSSRADSPWRERVLAPIQLDNFTPAGPHASSRPVRRSLIAPGPQDTLSQKYSLVARQEGASRRSSRRVARNVAVEPAASARIICEWGWAGCRGPALEALPWTAAGRAVQYGSC